MKIVSTVAFCTFLVPGIAFGLDAGQEQERQQDRDRVTEQQYQQERQQDQFGQERQQDQQRQQEQFGQERHMDQDRHLGQTGQQARQQLDTTQDGFLNTVPQGAVSIEKLIGSDVYSQIDNEEIGTIEDILVDQDGNPLAVIVSVGGFLGIGDKDVALSWDNIQLSFEDDDGRMTAVRTGTQPGARGAVTPGQERDQMQHQRDHTFDLSPDDYTVVVNLSRDALENAPEFERDWD